MQVEHEAVDNDVPQASTTGEVQTGCGGLFLISLPDRVLITKGKAGSCQQAWASSLAALASKLIELGETEWIIKQLKGIRCNSSHPNCSPNWGGFTESCPDGIAYLLTELKEKEKENG